LEAGAQVQASECAPRQSQHGTQAEENQQGENRQGAADLEASEAAQSDRSGSHPDRCKENCQTSRKGRRQKSGGEANPGDPEASSQAQGPAACAARGGSAGRCGDTHSRGRGNGARADHADLDKLSSVVMLAQDRRQSR
jgi:hypothetical protein